MTTPIPIVTPEGGEKVLAEALTALEASGAARPGRPPGLIAAMPASWVNRYQTLLYGEAGPRGRAVVGVQNARDLRHVSWPGPILLHAHWFAGAFVGCQDEFDAMERLAALQSEVRAFRERTGARLLWTAHNVFPHGLAFPRSFLALRRWIFEEFDALHVMQAGHTPLLEAAFDRKAPPHFVAPHMTYEGSMPDCVGQAAARAHYGLPQEAFVFAYFGSVQPYKNLDRLLSAFDRIAASAGGAPIHMLIGGVPSDSATVARLTLKWGFHPAVRLHLRRIPDHEIQYLHHAADVVVLPYGESLNSGAALMAASFRKPILMPAGPASEGVVGLGAIRYDDSAPDALEAAMRAVMKGERGPEDPQARAAVAHRRVSKTFFDALEAILPEDSATPGEDPSRPPSP